MNMSIEEVITALTINGAAALGALIPSEAWKRAKKPMWSS